MISKANLDDKNLIDNIIAAYEKDIDINPFYKINQLYPKTKLTEKHKTSLREREEDL